MAPVAMRSLLTRLPRTLLLTALVLSAGCAPRSIEILRRVEAVDAARLAAHVEALAGPGPRPATDSARADQVRAYLAEQLTSWGYTVEEEPTGISTGEGELTNLFAELPGRVDPGTVVELGAHYDSVPRAPGADDNASGVAGLLEVARLMADARLERTVRFCLFDGEELGLLGSRAHVERIVEARARGGPRVEGIIVLEMIGCASDEPNSQDAPLRIPLVASMPYEGNFIAVVGNFSSGGIGNIFEGAAARFVPQLRIFSANRIGGLFADAARSDHSPYWEAGLRGIMITDTANFRNPHYHLPSDTPRTLDRAFHTRVTRAAVASMMAWARPAPASEVEVHDEVQRRDSREGTGCAASSRGIIEARTRPRGEQL